MNVFMTTGTEEYLKKIQQEHDNEKMVIMQNEDHSLLLHETDSDTVFNEPRKYEVLDSKGKLVQSGFAVLNNIPVTEEGRPLFEYRFKNRAGLIESEPGFVAIRVLRPLTSDTYVIFTLWENEQAFKNWQDSKAYEKAHTKRGTDKGVDKQQPQIFPRASYVTKYGLGGE